MKSRITLFFLAISIHFASTVYGDTSWAPDFIIIGAQKAGTTELQALINQHPMIVKKRKGARGETHFFDLQFEKGVKWYRSQFLPRTEMAKIIGEKSPYYMFHPLVPERVHSLFPKTKIIMILRNPIDRAYSQYWHNVTRYKRENLSFEEAIAKEEARLSGEEKKLLTDPSYKSPNHQHYSYLARGRYLPQVKLWLSFFPKDQVLILNSDDFRIKPDKVMTQVFNFIGLDKCPLVYSNKKSEYPPMDPGVRKKLSDYFRPYNVALEKHLGRKFNWE